MLAYEKVILTLNGLLETNQACRRGFEAASGIFVNTEIADRIREFSMTHSRYALELGGIIEILGGSAPPETPETPWGRGWSQLPEAIGNGNELRVLAECLHGAEASMSTYQLAIGSGLPPAILELLSEQSLRIRATRDHLLSLRDRAMATSFSPSLFPGISGDRP